MISVAIAEDDFRIASIQEQFLQQISGITVVGKALNAQQTLELLEKKPVDLLLLDIYMPDMLGTDLLPVLKQRFPQTDVIMITAASEKKMLEEALHYGIFHYLIKPVPLEKFKLVIEEYRKKKQLLAQTEEVTQDIIDTYFAGKAQPAGIPSQLPTGIDSVTLNRVSDVLQEICTGISIEEMGAEIGASRTTARRYLEYLVTIGKCRVEHEYGIVGRPERKYFKVLS